MTEGARVRIISLRRADVCCVCGLTLSPGDRAGWDSAARSSTCTGCLPAPEREFDRGEAGASVSRTYARRAERHIKGQEQKVAADRAWREEIKADHPVFGRLATAITPKAQFAPEPNHVRSWGTGAPGEKRVGQVLDGIEGIVALHDRKVPGGRANIDHIAVTQAGVWVIDSKRYPGTAVEFRNVGGWFRTDERLYVGARDRTKLVHSMAWQVAAVTKALREMDSEVEVKPMLCFVGSTWGWFAKPFLVRGTAVCWPLALPEILARPGPLDSPARDGLARHLGVVLGPA